MQRQTLFRRRRRTAAIRDLRPPKGAMPLPTSPVALETQESVGTRSFSPEAPALALALVLDRSSLTLGIRIPQWVRQRCCSTLPAPRTRPREWTQWFITTLAISTTPLAVSPSLTTRTDSATTLLAITRCLKIYTRLRTQQLAI